MLKKNCSHRKGIECNLGLYGGKPSPGTCFLCPNYDGSPRGLGDIVYKVAQPIAKTIDKIAGTNIKGCSGCAKRRNKLNKKIQFE